jgi:hypothetical protein
VRFAVHQEQADDLIEALIAQHTAPRRLVVVSDDQRIKQAALRRHCQTSSCFDFLESLKRRRAGQPVAPAAGERKPQVLPPEEREFWLREFADLQNSRSLKDLSDPAEWQELDGSG